MFKIHCPWDLCQIHLPGHMGFVEGVGEDAMDAQLGMFISQSLKQMQPIRCRLIGYKCDIFHTHPRYIGLVRTRSEYFLAENCWDTISMVIFLRSSLRFEPT